MISIRIYTYIHIQEAGQVNEAIEQEKIEALGRQYDKIQHMP